MQELLTKQELAGRLKMKVRTVEEHLKKGLPKIKVGALTRFDFNEVVEYYKKEMK